MTMRGVGGGHSHAYDAANRMLWANTGSQVENYRYDGHGRRTRIARSGGNTYQIYGQDGTFLYERAPAGTITKHFYLGKRRVASMEGSTVRYHHVDHLGSVIGTSNSAGVVTASESYASYGSPWDGTYSPGPGYTGHVQDVASGLTYMQQRYYDPVAMRFVSPDPVYVDTTSGGNFNRYWYANNNPYKYVDPDGRLGCTGTHIQRVCDSGGVARLQTTARSASPFDKSQVEFRNVENPATRQQTGNTVVRDANRVVGMANRSGNRQFIDAINSVKRLIVDGRSPLEATGKPNVVAYTSFGEGYIGFIVSKYFSLMLDQRAHKFVHEVFHQTIGMEQLRQANPMCGWGCRGSHEHSTEAETYQFMRLWWDPSEKE